MKVYNLSSLQLAQLSLCEVVRSYCQEIIIADVVLISGGTVCAVFRKNDVVNDMYPQSRYHINRGLQKKVCVNFPHLDIFPSKCGVPLWVYDDIVKGDYSAGPWTDYLSFGLRYSGLGVVNYQAKTTDPFYFIQCPPNSNCSMIEEVVPPVVGGVMHKTISPYLFLLSDFSWP